MKVTMALLLLLAVVGMCVFTGCSGDDDEDEVTIPTALQGTWLVVASDDENAPVAGGLIDVASNGKVTPHGDSDLATAQITDDADVSGTVSSTGVLSLVTEQDGVTYTATGTLGKNDSGSGTWRSAGGDSEDSSGTFVACRANDGEFAGDWTGSVSGDVSGTESAEVDSKGVITGEVDAGFGVAELVGVINGNGDILAIWGGEGENPMVVAPGSVTSENEASGTWQADNDMTGTWEATRQQID